MGGENSTRWVPASDGSIRLINAAGTTLLTVTAAGALELRSGAAARLYTPNDAEFGSLALGADGIATFNYSLAVPTGGGTTTTKTGPFLYVPVTAGTPTGTPTAVTNMVPIVVDSTNHKLYFYSGGAWRDAGP